MGARNPPTTAPTTRLLFQRAARRQLVSCWAGAISGGAERARTVDLLSAIQAFVSRHLRTPPDSIFYDRLELSRFVRRVRTRRGTRRASHLTPFRNSVNSA